MRIFITGTDTNVGKTTIASWLCLHTGYPYVKPVQTGSKDGTDRQTASHYGCITYDETYIYPEPVSPHYAARLWNHIIQTQKLILPPVDNLIIEGAGGVLVPLNDDTLMIDWIKMLDVPVIVVARSGLGTINHTLLTLEALRNRSMPVLGVIMNGPYHSSNQLAIEQYGHTTVLACFPHLESLKTEDLRAIPLPQPLKEMFV